MKHSRQTTIMIICATILAASISACAAPYTGRVAVKGHEPFTYLALVTDTGDYTIVGSLMKTLWDKYQGRRITVKGDIVKQNKGPLYPPELNVTEIISAEP